MDQRRDTLLLFKFFSNAITFLKFILFCQAKIPRTLAYFHHGSSWIKCFLWDLSLGIDWVIPTQRSCFFHWSQCPELRSTDHCSAERSGCVPSSADVIDIKLFINLHLFKPSIFLFHYYYSKNFLNIFLSNQTHVIESYIIIFHLTSFSKRSHCLLNFIYEIYHYSQYRSLLLLLFFFSWRQSLLSPRLSIAFPR